MARPIQDKRDDVAKLKELLCEMLGCSKPPKPKKCPGRFNWRVEPPQPKKKRMLELSITNEQKIKITVAPVTATGRPAELDGSITVTVVSGSATAEVQPDGRSAYLISSDVPGDTQFAVEGDADLGSGVETISDVVHLTVQGARAANLGLTAGAPEAK